MVLIGLNIKGYCQLKVYEDNRVKIFGDRSTDDFNKDLTLQIYGKYGDYLTNGKIGFGDYGESRPMGLTKRVFIGELGTDYDSDRFEMCGSRGLYITWGQGYEYNNIIAKLDFQTKTLPGNIIIDNSNFRFNTDIYAYGLILNSDERFKEDIKLLNESYIKLVELKPVSYNLKPDKAFHFPENYAPENEKERQDLEGLSIAREKIKVLEKERFGFVAQDLEKLIPELVFMEGEDLYVDYLGLLPILVETIKKQQKQIASLTVLLKQ